MRLALVFALLVAGLVVAQLPDNVPSCALGCLGSTNTGCATTDIGCVCRSSDAQSGLFSCAQRACSSTDFNDSESLFRGICAAISASSSSPATTSSATSSLPSSLPASSSQSRPSSSSPSPVDTEDAGSSTPIGAEIGGALGGAALLAAVAALLFFLRRRRKRTAAAPARAGTDPEKQFHAPPVHQGSGASYDPFAPSQLAPAPGDGTPIGPYTARPLVLSPGGGAEDDGLTAAQKELVGMMRARGAAPAAVEDVVGRMRAENRGEGPAPPQYDFKDADGRHVMAAAAP